MKISSEGRIGSNWVDEIGDILKRNVRIKSINLSIFVLALIFLFYGMLYVSQNIGYSLVGFILFILIITFSALFGKKPIDIELSDILSYYLFGLYVRIDKYDGRKKHLSNEAIKIIKKINNLIFDFINSAKNENYLYFEFDKKSNILNKLRSQLKKGFTYFKSYESNKDRKEEFANAVRSLSFKLYNNKNIFDDDIRVFETLPLKKIEFVNEGWKKFKEIFDQKIKKYVKLISFAIVITLIIWYIIPLFFPPNTLETSTKLIITLTIIGTAIATEFFGKK